MLIVRDQVRAGTSVTIAPVYEILSVSARDIRNPVAENLSIVFSGWGAAALGEHLVWFDRDRPTNRVFGDLDLAYLQGEILKRSLQLRLGRQLVGGGVTGALQLDGGNALVRLPYGFGVAAYVGAPVSQRFDDARHGGDLQPAARQLRHGRPCVLDAAEDGARSARRWVNVEDHGDPSRRQVGGDLRLTPLRPLTVLANTSYDIHEERWAETNVVAQVQVLRKLLVIADYRHVEPDLLLARNSILAVFAVDRRNEVGGGVQVGPWRAITFDGDYHYLNLEPGDGHRAAARATWRGKGRTFGLEVTALETPQNDYIGARAFGSMRFDRFTGTLDLQEYAFDQPVNGQGSGHKNSFLATATLGYALGYGFDALVSASGGATPYFESRFDVMAKLAYNQSYHVREVR